MTGIALSRVHYPVQALGPGRRVGIWFQGCSIRCPGCISRDTWEAGIGLTALDDVLDAIAPWAGDADGLTVSGGEPFDQPEALEALLRGWRRLSERSVLLFTGHDYGNVAPWLADRPGLVDAIMAGRFEQAAGHSLALRGSDNQTLHALSPLGQALMAYDRPAKAEDRRLDVMFDAAGAAWFAGIPEEDAMRRLRGALAAMGHRAATSDQGASTR